jgi:heptosyltransferase-1
MIQLLIIKPSSLGDIVHGLQVAASLKEQVPDLRISWIVRDIFAPLVKSCEAVDQVFVFRRMAGTKGFFELMRDVRKLKFDWVFDFQGLLRTGLMTWRTLADHKVGRTDAREGARFFYDRQVPLPPGGADRMPWIFSCSLRRFWGRNRNCKEVFDSGTWKNSI